MPGRIEDHSRSKVKEEEIRNRDSFSTYLGLVRSDCLRMFSTAQLVPVACPACEDQNSRLEFVKDGFEYHSCLSCLTLFAHTRPTFESLQDFYTRSEATNYWVNEFFKPMAEARRQKIFRPRAEYVVRHFGRDARWRIADIGAGFGIFCEELRKLWPDSLYAAIEPSPEQAEICRSSGFEVIEKSVEEVEGHNNSFDLMTAFELLEHLHEPRRFILSVRALLKPGGWLLLTSLNGLGFDMQILWDKNKNIYPPCHINFFNPASLTRMLDDLGFKVAEAQTPGQLDWNIVEGAINHGDAETDRFWKLIAQKLDAAGKQELQDWISRNSLSSHMRVLAQKI